MKAARATSGYDLRAAVEEYARGTELERETETLMDALEQDDEQRGGGWSAPDSGFR